MEILTYRDDDHLIRATVTCVIFNQCGEVLVGRRCRDKIQGNFWQLVQGGVEGRNISVDAYREIEEEAGPRRPQLTWIGALRQIIYYPVQERSEDLEHAHLRKSMGLATGLYKLKPNAVLNPTTHTNGELPEFDRLEFVNALDPERGLAARCPLHKKGAYTEITESLRPISNSIRFERTLREIVRDHDGIICRRYPSFPGILSSHRWPDHPQCDSMSLG